MLEQDAARPIGAAPVGQDGLEVKEPSISVLDLLVILARHKMVIAVATLMFVIAAAVYASLLRDSFKAEAIILPPQQQQSSISAFASGALGNLGGSGMAAQLGLKSPADLYIGFLKSRTIFDGVIARFHLVEAYHRKSLSAARGELQKRVAFTSGKEALITISVEDEDPKRAAALTNAFVDGLYKLTSGLALSDASQRRLFFEQELGKEKNALADAEILLKNTQQSTGLVMPTGQAEALIHSASQLQANISSREIALQAVRTYATDQNPQVEILQSEISATQSQLKQLERKGTPGTGLTISAGNLPGVGLEYIRRMRDLRYHETLYELLGKQYEAARIDESKQSPVIQVVDRANVPDVKSGPHRLAMVAEFGLAGLVLSSLFAIAAHHLKTSLLNPAQTQRLSTLRSAVWFGR